jgi:hypothetical protein
MLIGSGTGAAQDTSGLARIEALLVRPQILCGHFDQSKVLVGLTKPVKSSGRFCVVAGKGILWRTLQPFASTLRLTRDEIIESRGDEVTQRLSAAQEPGVRVINDLLFSLLAGDLRRLTDTFSVDGKVGRNSWDATLAPRGSGMRGIIAGIELSGDNYVDHVLIRETGGDMTVIAFSGFTAGARAMQPDEARQFE